MSGSPDEYKAIRERMKDLSESLERVHGKIEQLEDQNKKRKGEIRTLRDDVVELTNEVEEATERLDQAEELLNQLEGTDDEVENIQSIISKTRDTLRSKIRRTNKRIANIEKGVDYESQLERDIPEESSTLEFYSSLPQKAKEDRVNKKSVKRAIEVYENYDSWSKYTPKGYVIKSGDLKRLLSEDISWSQIYRVMEKFNENTGDEYDYIETERTGKALIRYN